MFSLVGAERNGNPVSCLFFLQGYAHLVRGKHCEGVPSLNTGSTAQHIAKKARGWIDSLNEDLFVHLSVLYENKKDKKAA